MSLPVKGAPITTADIGFAVPIGLGEDVSNFTTFELILRAPSGAINTQVCQINPTNNCEMLLTIQANTFTEVGFYIAQPKLSVGAEIKFGNEFEIEVVDELQ